MWRYCHICQNAQKWNDSLQSKGLRSAKAPGKKPDVAKYSKPKSIWHVKNATLIVPLSPVASMK
jgi:hypothetical protein